MQANKINNATGVRTRFWLWGGLTGLLLPLALFALVQILTCFPIDFGNRINGVLGVLAVILILIVVILELPVIIIGRILNLPIETGTPAFMVYNLNLFGYILVVIFWIFVGFMIGSAIDRILARKL